MDAGRYKKHYGRVTAKAAQQGRPPPEKDWETIKMLWQRLIEAYIQTNGSREVNLPSDVRDPLLTVDSTDAPPPPETLDLAVAKVYELMEDSVLVPFLNSLSPQIVQEQTDLDSRLYDDLSPLTSQTSEGKEKTRWRTSRHSRHSPPPVGSVADQSHSAATVSTSPAANRKSTASSLSNAFKSHRFSARLSPTSSATSAGQPGTGVGASSSEVPVSLTDDSGETSSPPYESPMTPPLMSPPASERGHSHRDSGTWKKLGRLSQWKPARKKSQQFKDNVSTP